MREREREKEERSESYSPECECVAMPGAHCPTTACVTHVVADWPQAGIHQWSILSSLQEPIPFHSLCTVSLASQVIRSTTTTVCCAASKVPLRYALSSVVSSVCVCDSAPDLIANQIKTLNDQKLTSSSSAFNKVSNYSFLK